MRRDEISPERLHEIAGSAAALGDERAFTLKVGGVNAFQDAIFLDIDDQGPCFHLYSRLHQLATTRTDSPFPFVPHLTIAHFSDTAPIGRVPALLAPWRDRRFGVVTVDQVEVVTISIDQAYPALEPFATIPLRERDAC